SRDVSKQSAEHFYMLLAGIAAVVVAAKEPTHIITDFGYTADRVALFLKRTVDRLGLGNDVRLNEKLDRLSSTVRGGNTWAIHVLAANAFVSQKHITTSLCIYFWPFRIVERHKMPKPITIGELFWIPIRGSDVHHLFTSDSETRFQGQQMLA